MELLLREDMQLKMIIIDNSEITRYWQTSISFSYHVLTQCQHDFKAQTKSNKYAKHLEIWGVMINF